MALQAMKGKASVRGHHLIKQKRKISFFKKKNDYFYINNPTVMVMKIKMEKTYTQNFISHQNVFFIFLFCLPTKILVHVHKH